ncbi:MAG: gfo/Idh/MocA family oxidoreductase [Legionellales bacterium]|nr:gfo/Idh/MocA family oxidoreductase [Legionellales bacterium]
MQKIKCAVIGVGYLGKFHAEKYTQLPDAELVAVCDIDPQLGQPIADQFNVPLVTDYRELIDQVDAVSVVTPTPLHYQISHDCLTAGVHVLVEKPITQTLEQARQLIALAQQQPVIFQVGHLERFNSARLALDDFLDSPRFIESQRLAPFNPRNTDVNVILDLMIHDIDIIQSIVQSPVKHIDAQGAPILTSYVDIANARIVFENNCVANVTASRISFKTERKTRIFQPESYISIDFHNKQFAVFRRGEGEMFPGIPEISREQSTFEQSDALFLEIQAFVNSITHNTPPLVSGEDGYQALVTASQITERIHQYLATQNAIK